MCSAGSCGELTSRPFLPQTNDLPPLSILHMIQTCDASLFHASEKEKPMIEHCFSRTSVLTRLRQGLLGARPRRPGDYPPPGRVCQGQYPGTICGPVISSAGGSPTRGTRLRKSMRRWSHATSVACHRGRQADSPKRRRVSPPAAALAAGWHHTAACPSVSRDGCRPLAAAIRALPRPRPRRRRNHAEKLSPHCQALPRHLLAGGAHGVERPPRTSDYRLCLSGSGDPHRRGPDGTHRGGAWVPALSRGLWRASAWL